MNLHRARQLLPVCVLLLLCLVNIFSGSTSYAIDQNDINSIIDNAPFYDPLDTGACGASTDANLTGSNNIQKAYNFFISQGLNAIQASAVVGNLADESSLDPTIMQIGGNSDNPNDAGSEGWGIAQWTPGGKVIGIQQQLNVSGEIYDLATQLEIVLKEMQGTSPTGYSNLMNALKQINDLTTAVSFFQVNFEGGVAGDRQQDAQQIYQQYGGGPPSSDTGTSSSTSGCETSVSCNNAASTLDGVAVSTAGLDQTRQNVVENALCQLATWEQQPGYPWPCPSGVGECSNSYSETGYLKYSDNMQEEWCADFVSWILKQSGQPFTGGDDGGWLIPLVSNIQALGEQKGSGFTWHSASSGYKPQPGDIAIHGPNHTNIFIASSGGTVIYIGGDQGHGPYPGGSIVSIEVSDTYWGDVTGYVSPS